MKEYTETHQEGRLFIENGWFVDEQDLTDCDFGIQISADGRVWVCINGMAWLRFKPERRSSEEI